MGTAFMKKKQNNYAKHTIRWLALFMWWDGHILKVACIGCANFVNNTKYLQPIVFVCKFLIQKLDLTLHHPVQVEAADLQFDFLEVYISASSPSIPDIVPAR